MKKNINFKILLVALSTFSINSLNAKTCYLYDKDGRAITKDNAHVSYQVKGVHCTCTDITSDKNVRDQLKQLGFDDNGLKNLRSQCKTSAQRQPITCHAFDANKELGTYQKPDSDVTCNKNNAIKAGYKNAANSYSSATLGFKKFISGLKNLQSQLAPLTQQVLAYIPELTNDQRKEADRVLGDMSNTLESVEQKIQS